MSDIMLASSQIHSHKSFLNIVSNISNDVHQFIMFCLHYMYLLWMQSSIFRVVNSYQQSASHHSILDYCHYTTLSAYVRNLKIQGIPFNINWDIIKRAAPFNPITKICRLCISEKFHILFHPEDATLNQRSEFFSKCWHKEKHLLANN